MKYIIAFVMLFFLISLEAQKKTFHTIRHYPIEALDNNSSHNDCVWSTFHHRLPEMDENGQIERDELNINYMLIHSLPLPVRKIIAVYSKNIPEYVWDEKSDYILAKALGDFSSMKQAYDNLFKDGEIEIPPCREFGNYLSIVQEDGMLLFKSSRWSVRRITDEFKINRKGKIFYNLKPLKQISYDRKLIEEGYSSYNVHLNGEFVRFANYFLDEDNIESIIVNERKDIIEITQKNKHPEYFSRSDIDFSGLNIKIDNPQKLYDIYINNGAEPTTVFSQYTKLESSAIVSFKAGIYKNASRDRYWLYIRVK